jgi:hypothetical protein
LRQCRTGRQPSAEGARRALASAERSTGHCPCCAARCREQEHRRHHSTSQPPASLCSLSLAASVGFRQLKISTHLMKIFSLQFRQRFYDESANIAGICREYHLCCSSCSAQTPAASPRTACIIFNFDGRKVC